MNPILEAPADALKLRALDPDLPMLAARAAMELDNFKSSGETAFEAVNLLGQRLKNSLQHTNTMAGGRKALLDSGTASLVGRALNVSNWPSKISTIDQLGNEIWEVAQILEAVVSSPSSEPIEKIRDFCVALSECAASYRQAFHDLRPAHPFRR
jgi:hypothetical protein